MIIAKYFTDLTNIGHFILRMRFDKTLLYNIYVKFIFCFTINTLTASLDQDCETKRNGSKCQQLSGQVNNFSNTFSLFQFETKTTFYKLGSLQYINTNTSIFSCHTKEKLLCH